MILTNMTIVSNFYLMIKSQFADWSTRDDIKNQLNMDLTILLYQNGYPPEWDEEVFEKVMEQAENFKRFEGTVSTRKTIIYDFSKHTDLSMVAEEPVPYGEK